MNDIYKDWKEEIGDLAIGWNGEVPILLKDNNRFNELVSIVENLEVEFNRIAKVAYESSVDQKFTLHKAELLLKLPDYKLNSGYMEYGDKKTFAEGWNMCKNEVRDIITNLTDGK